MDEERILDKIDQLDQYIEEINKDLPESFEEYRSERRKFERLFQLCIETTIDISALILKEEGLGTPSDEESIIDKLIEADIFSEDLGNKVKRMRGFRNILVHRYGELKDEKAYQQLDRLKDFQDFRETVLEWLED